MWFMVKLGLCYNLYLVYQMLFWLKCNDLNVLEKMLELWEEDRISTTPLENAAFHHGVGPNMIKTAVSQIGTFRTVQINQLPII